MEVHGQDLRSQFPVLSAFRTPPLISHNPDLGPLRFVPLPDSLVSLLSSTSLLFPPQFPPQLSFPRFLCTTSAVPFSAAGTIASHFGPQPGEAASTAFSHNRLRLLRCPSIGLWTAFFPTGANSDQLGFVVLDLEFEVRVDEDGQVLRRSSKRFSHSIVRIVVNPVGDEKLLWGDDDCIIGYIMACTVYSAHWFAVKCVDNTQKIEVVYLCSKAFKSSGIAGACWSSQLPEQSAVLLENGSLFLFDLEPLFYVDKDEASDRPNIRGTRLKVSWNKLVNSDKTAKWFGCEFSWHPQILIVARSDAVFSLDFRSDPYNVSCLAKIEMSGTYASVDKDRFLTFSMAGADGFHFAVASNRLLILCDMRKPLKPVLQWVHGIDKPCFIDVVKLSQLRSGTRYGMYRWASESGFSILLGSFWSCEFGLFCYGPHLPLTKGSCDSKFSGTCKSFCAWELPSELSLSGRECRSGSCLVKEEFSKNDLPEWIDWRQKKDVVLGFGIIESDLSPVASEVDEFGGFTVVRLMSSGKLEAQRYRASRESARSGEEAVSGSDLSFEDSILDSAVDEGYKFVKIYQYIKLDYLKAFLRGNLSSRLQSSLKKSSCSPFEEDSFNPKFHAFLCEKLKMCGFAQSRSSPAISLVFNGISLPTTIREIAMTKIWSELPVGLLQLAFSSYSEFLEVHGALRDFYHDFPMVLEFLQLPPFILRKPLRQSNKGSQPLCQSNKQLQPLSRSNKWSRRVQRSDDYIVGPIVPLPVLSFLNRSHAGLELETAEEEGVDSQCDQVMQVAAEVARVESGPGFPGDHAVSLSNDVDEAWFGSQNQKRSFLLHEPGSFKPRRDAKCASLVSKVTEDEAVPGGGQGPSGPEMFNDLCPIKLPFRDRIPVEFSPQELIAFRILKKQFLKRQESAFGH